MLGREWEGGEDVGTGEYAHPRVMAFRAPVGGGRDAVPLDRGTWMLLRSGVLSSRCCFGYFCFSRCGSAVEGRMRRAVRMATRRHCLGGYISLVVG